MKTLEERMITLLATKKRIIVGRFELQYLEEGDSYVERFTTKFAEKTGVYFRLTNDIMLWAFQVILKVPTQGNSPQCTPT